MNLCSDVGESVLAFYLGYAFTWEAGELGRIKSMFYSNTLLSSLIF